MEEILKRYYQGETTLSEEKALKAAWQRGELLEEPIFGIKKKTELPESLSEKIQESIRSRQCHKIRQGWIIAGSAAAMLVLIISLRGLISTPSHLNLQLSDNLKKERFENALRVIGNVLEEKTPPVQKVLYEDHKLIITIE